MWLCLYDIVPFEYLSHQHLPAFICQDYLLLISYYPTISKLCCHTQSLLGRSIGQKNKDYQLYQTGNLLELNSYSTLSVLPPKLTWQEPTYSTLGSARPYSIGYLYYMAFIWIGLILRNSLLWRLRATLYHCWFILRTRSLPCNCLSHPTRCPGEYLRV